ncbi:MAG: LysM peptidoglycan-binding domain-containing protein [Anaerolineales bacterium]|nr:LysM peptidoglycan-binding domain-containing protein [Anaerolineales bacterium]
MNARRLILLLLLNAVVSVAATFAALYAWERWARPAVAPSVTAVPTAGPAADPAAATAEPTYGLPPVTPYPTPPPPTAVIHTVQSGETLGLIAQQYDVGLEDLLRANGLTDPNVLDAGQRLVIPIGGFNPTPTPAPTVPTVPPLPTATPNLNAPPPQLVIREVQAPGTLETEAVVIANTGGPVDLAGWTLSDGAGRVYIFPALTLFEGGIVNVHTRAGQDTVIDLYWGQALPAWAAGQLVLLADPANNLIARFTIP